MSFILHEHPAEESLTPAQRRILHVASLFMCHRLHAWGPANGFKWPEQGWDKALWARAYAAYLVAFPDATMEMLRLAKEHVIWEVQRGETTPDERLRMDGPLQ